MGRGLTILGVFARRGVRAMVGARLGLVGRERRRTILASELRAGFEELGPAFIKLGQLMSVRPDLFSPQTVFEMERLRDAVPAVPADTIRALIARELGAPLDEIFDDFDDVAVGSASIAQVHRATLREDYRPVIGAVLPKGSAVAIKVVRPGVETAIARDIEAARPLVRALARFGRLGRLNLEGLLDEFAVSLASECDLRIEGRIAGRFAHDFADDELLVVPRVVWPKTSARVLTTEFIDGWRLADITEAERRGIDGRALALHGATLFMRQVLEIGRFHADLHPSNLFITPDGRIAYLDFGIVGRTTPEQRVPIAQVLAATVYGDAERALRYSAELGLVVPPASHDRVTEDVAALMRRTLAGSPRDVRSFAIGFLGIMDAERIAVPVGFGLLIKALVTVEGVARALYPDIDIVEAAKPYATRLIARTMLEPSRLWERTPEALRAAMNVLLG